MSCDEQMHCCAGKGPDWTLLRVKPDIVWPWLYDSVSGRNLEACTAVTTAEVMLASLQFDIMQGVWDIQGVTKERLNGTVHTQNM